jgi:aryl-alcohol dehydrogenase-like predicted oxidoreductase
MEYRRVGKSGLVVSAISLGAWLTYGSNVVEQETSASKVKDLKALDVKITPELDTRIEALLGNKPVV